MQDCFRAHPDIYPVDDDEDDDEEDNKDATDEAGKPKKDAASSPPPTDAHIAGSEHSTLAAEDTRIPEPTEKLKPKGEKK